TAVRIGLQTNTYPHEVGYRRLLGLNTPQRVISGRIGELTLYVEPWQNGSKSSRFRELRRRLRSSLPSLRVRSRRVYLKRGQTGEPRNLSNESEIEELLSGYGFETIEPARLTTEDIA